MLQLRFQALALFGLPHSGQWRSAGKRTSGSGQEVFPGLPADSWVGVMSWRFKKGRKTVASGLARSQAPRVGSSKGRANCTIAEGLKPRDTTPPALFILPADDAWHHAPATVQLTANDDFSGVQSVRYSVDGGPKNAITNGSTFSIPNQGQHTVDWEATDVAGNTGTRSAAVRVDSAPPTKPVLSRPFSVTQSATPTLEWSASADSGSGVRGYLLTIRRQDGSVAAFQAVGANTTSLVSPATLTDGATYTAVVTAVDNTADLAWTTDSDTLTFRVDSHADATGFRPASGTILSGGLRNGPFTIALDRAADRATVSNATVKLDHGPSYSAGCANTSCTSITVTPSSGLGEGHYVLSLNGVKSADEGLTFAGSANYAVPFTESGSISAALLCGNPSTSTPYTVSAAPAGQTAFLDFDISYSGGPGWTMEAFLNGAPVGSTLGGAASGHFRLDFPSSSGGTLTFQLTSKCGGGNASASNLFGSRYP
jgi:hypothetical protein